MRWLALLFLVANLALAGWIVTGSPMAPPDPVEPPPEIGTLTLLRESLPQPETPGACFTVGPFPDAERAEEARERLAALGVSPRQRRVTSEAVYGYQVLLPPAASREQALEVTRELAAKGVEDYYVIRESGPHKNAVSLGLFERKRYAERHAGYLENLGFAPRLRLRTRERVDYWHDYRDPEGRVEVGALADLAASEPLKRLTRPCEGDVSGAPGPRSPAIAVRTRSRPAACRTWRIHCGARESVHISDPPRQIGPTIVLG